MATEERRLERRCVCVCVCVCGMVWEVGGGGVERRVFIRVYVCGVVRSGPVDTSLYWEPSCHPVLHSIRPPVRGAQKHEATNTWTPRRSSCEHTDRVVCSAIDKHGRSLLVRTMQFRFCLLWHVLVLSTAASVYMSSSNSPSHRGMVGGVGWVGWVG